VTYYLTVYFVLHVFILLYRSAKLRLFLYVIWKFHTGGDMHWMWVMLSCIYATLHVYYMTRLKVVWFGKLNLNLVSVRCLYLHYVFKHEQNHSVHS